MKSVIDKFEDIVCIRSDEKAVVLESGDTVSYGQLNSLANTIGLTILSHLSDASEDILISVMMDRRIGLIAVLLSVLKTGSAYVPVDPSFPPDRQTYIFSHSQCQILIADQSSYEQGQSLGVEFPPVVLIVDDKGYVVNTFSNTSVPPQIIENGNESTLREARSRLCSIEDGGLQYVLYTSGSTGKPKGVMVTLGGVSNIVEWFADELQVAPGCRVLGLTTVCFDISGLEIFLPLTRGGVLVMVASATQKNPFRLLDVITDQCISIVQATPTTYEMMLATGWTGNSSIDFLVGGEAFRPSLLPLLQLCKSFRNVYGPTETTIWSSSHLMDKSMNYDGSIPIGIPISKTTFYLVNCDDSPTKTSDGDTLSLTSSEEGELLIGGAGVARGYLHASELTAQRFMKNPFGEGRIYRTGDLVRRLSSGDYVFVRRIDDQVKIDGFRIELGEIEQVYGVNPLVEQAVVLVRNGKLVAYLKPKKGRDLSPLDVSAINDIAYRSLTHYMQPKAVVVVKEFPQTANGKLDRKALPDPVEEVPFVPIASSRQFEFNSIGLDTPHSMESHILRCVQKLRPVDMKWYSTFSQLAVDSLSAVVFVHLLSESLSNYRINPEDIYSNGVTVRSLAEELYEKLDTPEHKHILREHSIDSAYQIQDEESGLSSSSKDIPPDAVYESEWSSAVMSNSRLLIGLRGFVAFMVLWDHYHPKRTPSGVWIRTPIAWQADNYLFVILSGVTTILQLRDPIIFTKLSTVQPRAVFDYVSFLYSRFVGVFPVFWLALLFNAPRWYLQNEQYKAHPVASPNGTERAICAALYPLGLKTYFSPQCKLSGPRDLFYPSAIWIAFIYYSIIRFVLTKVLDHAITASERNPDRNSWLICLAYSRPNSRGMAWVYGVILALACPLLCQIGSIFPDDLNTGHRYLMFFIAGAIVSYFVMGVHFCMYYGEPADAPAPRKSSRTVAKRDEITQSRIQSYALYLVVCLFDHKATVDNVLERYTIDNYKQFFGFTSIPSLLWRFSPDLIALCWALLLSPFPEFRSNAFAKGAVRWVAVPTAVMIYIALSLLQPRSSQLNISRWFFESPIMNFMGYITYPSYLLQQVVFEFYAHVIKDDIDEGVFPMTSNLKKQARYTWNASGPWFNQQPLDLKIYGMLCFLFISWLVQKYFQDGLVLAMVAKLHSYSMKKEQTESRIAKENERETKSLMTVM